MDKQNQLQKQEKTLLTYLAAGITNKGTVDTTNIDRIGLNICLKQYKGQNGYPKYGELIKIPTSQRINELAKTDLRGTVTTLSVALTLAMEAMNLKNGMNAIQVVDLAEAIIDDSEEDRLAIEDVLLFCQRLTRGHYGTLYESMDAPKFMTFFNQYRDERWNEAIRIRDEKHEEYKKMGDADDYNRKYVKDCSPFGQHMEHLRNKIEVRKDDVYESTESPKRKRE